MDVIKWILIGLGCWISLSVLVAAAWALLKSAENRGNGKTEFYRLWDLMCDDPNTPSPQEEAAILRCRAIL